MNRRVDDYEGEETWRRFWWKLTEQRRTISSVLRDSRSVLETEWTPACLLFLKDTHALSADDCSSCRAEGWRRLWPQGETRWTCRGPRRTQMTFECQRNTVKYQVSADCSYLQCPGGGEPPCTSSSLPRGGDPLIRWPFDLYLIAGAGTIRGDGQQVCEGG